MVTSGFGPSTGEFIKAVQILNTICKALKDTGGAAADHEETHRRLNYLSVLLQHLQAEQSEESRLRQDHVIWERHTAGPRKQLVACVVTPGTNTAVVCKKDELYLW